MKRQPLEEYVNHFKDEFMAELWYLRKVERGDIPKRPDAADPLQICFNIAQALLSLAPIPGLHLGFILSNKLIQKSIELGSKAWQTGQQAYSEYQTAQTLMTGLNAAKDLLSPSEGSGSSSTSESTSNPSLQTSQHGPIDLKAMQLLSELLGRGLAQRYEHVITHRLNTTRSDKSLQPLARAGAKRCFQYLESKPFLDEHSSELLIVQRTKLLDSVSLANVEKSWREKLSANIGKHLPAIIQEMQSFDLAIIPDVIPAHRILGVRIRTNKYTPEKVYTRTAWYDEKHVYESKSQNTKWFPSGNHDEPKYGYAYLESKNKPFNDLKEVTRTVTLPTDRFYRPVGLAEIKQYLDSKEVKEARLSKTTATYTFNDFLKKVRNYPGDFQVVCHDNLSSLSPGFAFGNFKGVDFSGATISGDISGCCFQDAYLVSTIFHEVHCDQGSEAQPLNFSEAKLAFAQIVNGRIQYAMLTQADLSFANMTGCTITNISHEGTRFYKTQLSNITRTDSLQQIQSKQARQIAETQDKLMHHLEEFEGAIERRLTEIETSYRTQVGEATLNYQKTLAELAEQKKTLTELSTQKIDVDRLRQDYQQEIKRLETQQDDHKREIQEELNRKLTGLTLTSESLQKAIDEIKSESMQSTSLTAIRQLSSRVTSVEARTTNIERLPQRGEDVTRLSTEQKEHTDKITGLEQDVKGLKTNTQTMETNQTTLLRDVSGIRTERESDETRITSLEKETGILQTQMRGGTESTLLTRIERLDTSIGELPTRVQFDQLAAQKVNVQDFNQNVTRLDTEQGRHETNITNLDQKVGILQNQVRGVTESALLTRIEGLSTSIDGINRQLPQLVTITTLNFLIDRITVLETWREEMLPRIGLLQTTQSQSTSRLEAAQVQLRSEIGVVQEKQQRLIERETSPNSLLAFHVRSQQSELIKACENGDFKVVTTTIEEKGALPSIPDAKGKMPLAAAVWGMNPEIIKYLLGLLGPDRSMTWDEIKQHNQDKYSKLHIVSEFKPVTHKDWFDVLMLISPNPFLRKVHFDQVKAEWPWNTQPTFSQVGPVMYNFLYPLSNRGFLIAATAPGYTYSQVYILEEQKRLDKFKINEKWLPGGQTFIAKEIDCLQLVIRIRNCFNDLESKIETLITGPLNPANQVRIEPLIPQPIPVLENILQPEPPIPILQPTPIPVNTPQLEPPMDDLASPPPLLEPVIVSAPPARGGGDLMAAIRAGTRLRSVGAPPLPPVAQPQAQPVTSPLSAASHHSDWDEDNDVSTERRDTVNQHLVARLSTAAQMGITVTGSSSSSSRSTQTSTLTPSTTPQGSI